MGQMRIFLSHSSQDKKFADALVRALRGAGADVWYDEHNLGTGQLLEEIQRELRTRHVFIVILSVSAFKSSWVIRECTWAFQLYDREPSRTMLPIVVTPIRRTDFDNLLFLESFKRVAGPGDAPYPRAEAIDRALGLLGLPPQTVESAGFIDDPNSLVAEGRLLIARDLAAQALPLLDRAIEQSPTSFDAWEERGGVNWKLGRAQEALACFECAVILAPSDAAAWGNMGLALAGLAHYDEALTAYDQALTLDQSTWLWTRRGEALNALRRYDEALESFRQALSPHLVARIEAGKEFYWVEAGAHRGQAVSLRALGREAAAQEAERRAKELGG